MTQPSEIEVASTGIRPTELDPLDRGSSEFDPTTEPRPTGQRGVFEVELSDLWASLVGVHGGSLTAIAVRSAALVEPERRVRTLTTGFLSSVRSGPAEVTVHEIRRGRSVTTLAVERTSRAARLPPPGSRS